MLIRTSRSQIVTGHACRRLVKLQYFDCLERVRENVARDSGVLLHTKLAELVKMGSWTPLSGTPEQVFLLTVLLRLFQQRLLPILLAEYEILSLEQPHDWLLAPNIVMPLKADLVLRSRQDDLLYLVDYKTTSSFSPGWKRKWERDPQVLAYINAAQEIYGELPGGLIIIAFARGKTAEKDGRIFQDSPLCYPWFNGEICSLSYDRRKGFERQPAWEHFTPGEFVELFGAELDHFLFMMPPILPSPQRLAAWRAQEAYKEHALWEAAQQEDNLHLFPQNFDHCDLFGERYPCEMQAICFTEEVAQDPIGSGLYRIRVDHHQEEEGE